MLSKSLLIFPPLYLSIICKREKSSRIIVDLSISFFSSITLPHISLYPLVRRLIIRNNMTFLRIYPFIMISLNFLVSDNFSCSEIWYVFKLRFCSMLFLINIIMVLIWHIFWSGLPIQSISVGPVFFFIQYGTPFS